MYYSLSEALSNLMKLSAKLLAENQTHAKWECRPPRVNQHATFRENLDHFKCDLDKI